MNKLSALIITHNEEQHIAACIASLSGVADEIIIVDSMSQDHTALIARDLGAKVYEVNFEGYGKQKNKGAKLASFDLILSIDADEILSPELQVSILNIKGTKVADAYSLRRLNYIGSRAIRSAGWYPDERVRLYDRQVAHWDDRAVHEILVVNGSIAPLKGDLLHYSYADLTQVKTKSEHYARLGAAVYRGQSFFLLFVRMIVNPGIKFFKMYFLKQGFTDGYLGLMISYYRARETFLKYYLALR